MFSDWDIDGAVSAAEILYSQAVLGMYPVDKKCNVELIPTSPRSIARDFRNIKDVEVEYIIILDIAYSKFMNKVLSVFKEKGVEVLYVDHHISTAIHADEIRSRTVNLVIGKSATAILVYNLLKSHGLDVTDRLRAFIEAVSVIEKGDDKFRIKSIDRRLVDIVVAISRTLIKSKSKDLWIKTVNWLTEPLPRLSIPFSIDIKQFVSRSQNDFKELKAIANEIALSAIRIFNMRFIDISHRNYPYKSTSIASALYRLLKTPVFLLAKSRRGRKILVIKSNGTLAYDIALHLYRAGIAKDIVGHQTLTISLLRPDVSKEVVLQKIREIITSGPAGIRTRDHGDLR